MFKSTLDKVSEDAPLVTSASIGHRVLLANADNEVAASGTLRFVGDLEGQNGIFCGVELTGPYGKNDGSYRGVNFFRCPPNHGLFLPIHRVQMAEKRTLPQRVIRSDRLVHSAIATVDLNSSITSSDMDGSRLSTTSYGNWMDTSSDDDVDMTDSHFTYNVTRPQYLLQEVEDPQPLIAIDEDWAQYHVHNFSNGNINTSYVVTNPTMDRRDLPVIETPSVTDDLTPMVEENPINGNFIVESSHDSFLDQTIADVEDPETLINIDERDEATINADKAGLSNDDSEKKASPEVNGQAVKTTTSKPPPVEKKERKPKVRVPLREMIAAPLKPVNVERPKRVNKQQLLMEQILANKKENKDTPKKPARSRLSELWTQSPAVPKSENAKGTPKQMATTKPSTIKNPSTPVKIDVKSKIDTGVRLRPTPNKPNVPPVRASAPVPVGRPLSNCGKTAKVVPAQNPSTSRNSANTLASSKTPVLTPGPRKRPSLVKLTNLEKKLLQTCGDYKVQSTVLGLIISNTANNLDTIAFKCSVSDTTIVLQKEEIALLTESLKQLEGSYQDQIRVLKQQHTDEVNNLDEANTQRIQALEKAHANENEKHSVQLKLLDDSLRDEKEKVEELRKAFDKTQNEQIQVLNEEIRSLNVMIDLRNEDIRQLRKGIEAEKQTVEKYQLAEKEMSNKLQEFEHDASNYKKVLEANKQLKSEINKLTQEIELLKSNINSKESMIQLYTQRVESLEASRRPSNRQNVVFGADTY